MLGGKIPEDTQLAATETRFIDTAATEWAQIGKALKPEQTSPLLYKFIAHYIAQPMKSIWPNSKCVSVSCHHSYSLH